MNNAIIKIWDMLEPRERGLFYILVIIGFLASMAEIVGLGAMLVLLNVLAKPDEMLDNAWLGWVYELFGFESLFGFQLVLSLAVFAVVFLGLMARAVSFFTITRYVAMRGFHISRRLLESLLHLDYTHFIQRNPSEISKNVLSECEQLVVRVLMPCMVVVTSVVRVSTIVVLIIVVDYVIAFVTVALLVGGYVAIYFSLRARLERAGAEIFDGNAKRFKLLQEVVGGFKEVKLMSLERSYVERFSVPSLGRASAEARSNVLREMPRFGIEGLSIVVLVIAILILMLRSDGDLLSAIPTLGIFALSAMRLLPALQQTYHAIAMIRGAQDVINTLHREYMQARGKMAERQVRPHTDARLEIRRALELDRATFAYPQAERMALKDFSLTIPTHTTLGIVGGTGAGKTTLIDIILGLLPLQSGSVRVDDTPLGPDTLRSWQNSLGYVPQSIYLVDDTIAANIAFGVPEDRIDMDKVIEAARVAALHDFVVSDLPDGYGTVVGDRGIRLSGGQRQRIGIARAIFSNPSLLILDEATSALDNITERSVIRSIHAMSQHITVIMIAHRLSTVQNCDTILLLESGQISASGTYDELLETSAHFREMTGEK